MANCVCCCLDFGFCFDIAPGGITFERAPFKLTAEMIAVMGGSIESQAYRWFEELCVKSFLAARPYCEQLAHLVLLMLDSGYVLTIYTSLLYDVFNESLTFAS